MKVYRFIFVLVIIFTLPACNTNRIKIDVDDIESSCDITCFRGIKPDIYYDDLVAIAGEPNEFIDEEGDEEGHNPIYYYKEGKVVCYWSGHKDEEIGLVSYTPFNNIHMRIDDFIKGSLNGYDINNDTKTVAVFKGDTLYFLIYLDEMRIMGIDYWLAKKKLFNIADEYD